MHAAWHSALYACDIYGRIMLPLTAAAFTFLFWAMHRARMEAVAERRARFDADLEAILREGSR